MQNALEPRDLKMRLDAREPVAILDVREPHEFEGWNIPGSLNVPLRKLLAGAPAPAAPLVVTVCASGTRSEIARAELARRGVAALNLEGGMTAWNGVYDRARIASSTAEVWQLRRVGKGCLSYVVVSEGEAAVIDPTLDVDEYLRLAREQGARITTVLDTHAHADHVSGSRTLVGLTGAAYHAPDEVGPSMPHERVGEGSRIRVGGARLVALHTPGHTPQSMSYRFEDLLFTGDSLFVDSVGRPDLGQDPAPNAHLLWGTLQRILRLGEARVLPGHFGEGTKLAPGIPIEGSLASMGDTLPALKLDEAAFAAWVARNALPKPANFETIKRINKGSREITDAGELRALEAGPNRCAVSG